MDVVEALQYHFIRRLFFASRLLWRHRFSLAEIQLTAIVTVAITPAKARRLQQLLFSAVDLIRELARKINA